MLVLLFSFVYWANLKSASYQWMDTGKSKVFFNNIIRNVPINVSTERLKWCPMLRKAPYVKQCLYVLSAIYTRFGLLIGPNDVVCYDVTLYSAFKRSVNTLIDSILKQRTELNWIANYWLQPWKLSLGLGGSSNINAEVWKGRSSTARAPVWYEERASNRQTGSGSHAR